LGSTGIGGSHSGFFDGRSNHSELHCRGAFLAVDPERKIGEGDRSASAEHSDFHRDILFRSERPLLIGERVRFELGRDGQGAGFRLHLVIGRGRAWRQSFGLIRWGLRRKAKGYGGCQDAGSQGY
jgi:hypothetical protein